MGPRIVGPLVEKFLGSQSNNLVGRPCVFYPYNDFNVVARSDPCLILPFLYLTLREKGLFFHLRQAPAS